MRQRGRGEVGREGREAPGWSAPGDARQIRLGASRPPAGSASTRRDPVNRPSPSERATPSEPAAAPPVPILMYHEVAPTARADFARFTVTTREFAWQMAWLARRGFTTIGLDELVAARRGQRALPRRPVVITFDDGFVDSGRYAPPILEGHAFTATFYVVAGLTGQSSRWLRRELGFELPLMGWDALHRLRAAGHHVGSHTVSHPRLARVGEEEIREELARARALLEQGLGEPVVHLAYPFGSHDERVVRIAGEAGYVTACTTLEALSHDEPALALHRVPVYGTESRLDFVARLRTARSAGELARRTLRRMGVPIRASRS